jgi:copper chaperone CopZ
VRGAVEKMPGVSACDVQAGKADIKVSYDPSKTNPEQLLEGMKAAGQPAKAK